MKKMVLILATIIFIVYLGCVGSAEQLLKENSFSEDSHVTLAESGTVEDDSAKTTGTVDKGLSTELSSASSITSGLLSKTHTNSNIKYSNNAPVAFIDSITPNPALKGSSVTFRGSGTDKDGRIQAYLWTIDGKIVSTKASFSTSNIAVGTHTIKFKVQDNSWKWSEEITAILTINDPNVAPVAFIDSITPNPALKGSSVTFRGSGTDKDGRIQAYLWTIDGKIVSTKASFTTSNIAVGTHTISFWVQDNSKKWSEEATTTLTITDPNAPVARIDSITPNPAPTGSSVTFRGSGTDKDGTIKAYLWTIDGKELSSKASFSTSNIAAGTHTITLRVRDNSWKWSEEATATLTINARPNVIPVASIDLIDPNPAINGSIVTFTGSGTDTDGTVVTYLWKLDGTNISHQSTFTNSSIPVGTHTIAFWVQDDDGAWSKEVNTTLTINERPNVIPVASIDLIDPNPAINGSIVTFTGSGTDTDGTVVTYLWKLDGTNISHQSTFTNSSIPVGTHTIAFWVQDDDGAWSKEVNTTLTINERPEVVPSGMSVILTFDDGFKSDYDIVYQELTDRNMRSTHYIIANKVGEDETRMSWNDIKTMSDAGFDMECHSYTHPELIKNSSNEIIQQMVNVNNAFVSHGLPAPRHTAYPFGEYNDDVISVISSYRDSGRVVSWQNNAYYPVDSLKKPYELPCYPTDFNNTIAEIDKAIAGNYTLILGFHEITEIRSGTYEMSISEFESILDYIESKNIPTQTIAEYYDKTFQIPNVAPIASIDEISPNPANEGAFVYFKGNGTDVGGAIKAYLWTIDGSIVSTKASFITSTSDLAPGTHIVTFRVQDNDGVWSKAETEELTINVPGTPVVVPSGTTVILTFNGGRESDYDIVYPLLKECNIRSTHYILTSLVGADDTHMTWEEIKEMYNDRFDMECNGNTFVSFIDPATNVSDQMLKVNEAFVTNGMSAPRHTAYPFGEYNNNVKAIVEKYRDTGRNITWRNGGHYPVESLKKRYELPCYPTEYHGTIGKIDDAITGNYTLILGFNHITEKPGQFDISVAEFVSIINYIESNNIPTQTIAEYYEENFGIPSVASVESIDLIDQSTETEGIDEITFTGSGNDEDVTGSSTETGFSNSTSDIATGNHSIKFSFQDDEGAWSEGANSTLKIETLNVTSASTIESFEPSNVAPVANIVSIDPRTTTEGSNVTFTGNGTDEDGTIVAYLWTLEDGTELSTNPSFSTSSIAAGTHTIKFSVQDDHGTWSEEATATLEIEPPVQVQNGTTIV